MTAFTSGGSNDFRQTKVAFASGWAGDGPDSVLHWELCHDFCMLAGLMALLNAKPRVAFASGRAVNIAGSILLLASWSFLHILARWPDQSFLHPEGRPLCLAGQAKPQVALLSCGASCMWHGRNLSVVVWRERRRKAKGSEEELADKALHSGVTKKALQRMF